jgi:cyanophycin synthetase
MHIEEVKILNGPNIYSHQPMMLMRLDLQDLTNRESFEIKGFNQQLLACLPGLHDHHCSLGKPGGFVQRLEEGTYFGHIVEHVAIELTALAGFGANHGKTRETEVHGVYNVIIECRSEEATEYLMRVAVQLVEGLTRYDCFPLAPHIWEAKQLHARTELGPSTRAIVDAARQRNIPWRRHGTDSLVQLGYGKHRHFIQAATTDTTSATAVELVQDKESTKQLLRGVNIAVPDGDVVTNVTDAVAAMKKLGESVVVKPLDGNQGRGVSLGITSEAEMNLAFRTAADISDKVLIEEQLAGRNYRLLVVNNRLVAASERLPCQVTGDGKHQIQELINIENENSLRGSDHEKPLSKIKIDQDVIGHLKHSGLSLTSVPNAGESVVLSNRVNLSVGATARDVTDEVHPAIARLSERAARVAGLNICGVDLISEDIRRADLPATIIELNAGPGLRMHHFPTHGRPRDAGGAIIDMLFPNNSAGRIPIVSITGTNGKTTVARITGRVFEEEKRVVGMTTTSGIYIDGQCVAEGDMTGPQSARTVLSDPSVEIAVLETARGGIVRRGLGYDWSDVGVMTNIGDDHIGQDGIQTVEDILFIKSLVAERVREGGTLVLNADDVLLAKLKEQKSIKKLNKNYVYFSLRKDNPVVRRHVAEGGVAYIYDNNWLCELTERGSRKIVNAVEVPLTMQGSAEFQISNLLSATAACRALGVSITSIANTLKRFKNCVHNPGRANLYQLNGGYLMVDYGHNSDAFAAICRMAAQWKHRRVTGVVGVPGDRDDSLIWEAAQVAARGFHRVIVREDDDTRGRERGVVARMLCKEIVAEAPNTECEVVLNEMEASRHAIKTMEPGEIIILFYDQLKRVQSLLDEYAAKPIATLPPLDNGKSRERKRLQRVLGTGTLQSRQLRSQAAYADVD